MPVLKWAALFKGYLVVSLKGRGVVKFLNLAAKNHFVFWDMNFSGPTLTFKVNPRDFKKIKPLVRKTGCRVKILEKQGLPFIVLKSRSRKGLLVGVTLFCFIIYFFSLFVWDINITGNKEVATEEILAVLEKYGVKRGIPRRKVDLHELERRLLLEMKELSWVGASLEGVFLEVQVVERLREPPPKAEAVDLVAAKDGLVVDVLVLAGEAAVSPGDTVQKDQVLIYGKEVFSWEVNGEYVEYQKKVKARGIVEAAVWYEGHGECPLCLSKKKKTGKEARSLSLILGDNSYHLWGVATSPYRNYELEIIKRSFAWRNIRFPVELISSSYRELEVEIWPLSPGEALQVARWRAREKLNSILPRGAEIKKRSVEDYYFWELGKVGCRILVETREDIAVPRVSQEEGRDISY